MRSPCFRLKTHIRDGEQGCRGRPRPVGRVVYCSTIWLFPSKPVTMAEVEGRITDCSRRLTLRASTRYGFRAVATTFENAVLVPPWFFPGTDPARSRSVLLWLSFPLTL